MNPLVPYSYRDDPAVPKFSDDRPILIFDGICVLCSRSANFVLGHDRNNTFRLTAAQSPIGDALYRHYGMNPTDYDSVILLEDGKPWIKSEAAIRTAAHLGLPWSLAIMLRIVPQVLRDAVYDYIARNRYRIFGKRETCHLPTPDNRARFL